MAWRTARRPTANRRAESGFTLIEMIVAIVVLAVGVAGALATFGVISRAGGVAAEYDQAALLAERRLTEVTTAGVTPVSEAGDFGEENQPYHWEQEVVQAENDDTLLEVHVTVLWENGGSRHSVEVSTYMFPEDTTTDQAAM